MAEKIITTVKKNTLKEAKIAVKAGAKKSIVSKEITKKAETKLGNIPSKPKANTGNTMVLQQFASGLGKGKKQIGTLIGLRLNKLNKISILQDTPAIRGMVNKVSHLVKIIDSK